MINHFQFKPLFENSEVPGWHLSFYSQKQKYTAIYYQNGQIEWTSSIPEPESSEALKTQIHELMLYHVYDK